MFINNIHSKGFVNICICKVVNKQKGLCFRCVDTITVYVYQHEMICKHLCIFKVGFTTQRVYILGPINMFVNNIKWFVNICTSLKLYMHESVYILGAVNIDQLCQQQSICKHVFL